MRVSAVLTVAATLAGTRAAADPPAECADITNPTHDGALKMQSLGDQLMSHSLDFQKRPTLDGAPARMQSVANAARVVRCSEGKLSAKELPAAKAFEARAEAWAQSILNAEAAEATFRTDVLQPLCIDVQWIANARACIVREKSNPSGVADLHKLHECGVTIQELQPKVDALLPIYKATRHHAFADWQSEAACVANGWGDTAQEY